MAGVKKATKKFEKNKLKGELERRNARKPAKQRHQLVEKRKARRAQENGEHKAEPAKDPLQDMTMDEFFQGGFELPQAKSKKAAKKRKRTEQDDDSSSAESFQENPVAPDSEEASGSEEEDPLEEHKGELSALADKDPEFYKYLQENDAELLDFGAMADAPAEDGPPRKKAKGSATQDGSDAELEDLEEGASSAIEISLDLVEKWKERLVEQHSLTALREVVLAFRAAVHDDDDEKRTFKYSVSSPDVYHMLLITALEQIPLVLNHHLPVKETAAGKVRVRTDSKKFSNLSPVLNTYTNSILSLLASLSDDATLKLTISSLMPLVPYILSFKKLLKNLVKAVIGVWSDASHSEATRINAFLLVRRVAMIGDATIREAVLRSTYQALVRSSRNTTVYTLSAINLMKNSAVELWGFDAGLAYTTGFTSIRQLAIHLRTTITQPTKDSYKAIYNWQYVHSLDFWSRVLAQHCAATPASASNATPNKKKPTPSSSSSPLHPLIYPLVQITLGALRLIPTPTYFPLRFHLVQALLRVSRATNTYIPLAPALLEVLQSPELRGAPKPSTQRPLDFAAVLRAPKAYLRTRVYQDGVGEQVVALLAEFFGVWAKSVAFPELVIPPTVLLKRWLKDAGGGAGGAAGGAAGSRGKGKAGGKARRGNANGKLNAAVGLLVQKLAAHAAFVEQQRARVEFAVGDRRAVATFLADVDWSDTPLGAYVLGLRRQRDERDRLLADSRREGAGRREKEAKDAVADDDEDDDMDDGEDEEDAEGMDGGEEVDEDMDGVDDDD